MIEEQYLTPGGLHDDLFGLLATSPVRCREAALGSWMPAKMKPWSSSGRKPVGMLLPDHAGKDGHAQQEEQAGLALPDGHPAERDIAVGRPAEDPVEPVVKLLQQAGSPLLRLQQQRAEGGGKGEGVEGGDDDRDGDGHGELLVELPGDPGDEGGRDEDRRQDDGDGDDRAGYLLHRLERRLLGGHAVLDVVLHRLDNDDGVIDDQADGQYHAEEREGVDGKAEQREERMKVPTNETGTARSGISVARHPCRKMKTTRITRMRASTKVCSISFIPSVTARVVSSATV